MAKELHTVPDVEVVKKQLKKYLAEVFEIEQIT
jgi:hypothetical protein